MRRFSRRLLTIRHRTLRTMCSSMAAEVNASASEEVMNTRGVQEEYMNLINSDKLRYDEHQYKLIKTMDRVQQAINDHVKVSDAEKKRNMRPRGLYIYGEVGTGKTMLMDLLLKSTKIRKRRVHFHKFMLDVHKIIHDYKQELLQKFGRERNLNLNPSRDPILHCAKVIRDSAELLCFDEFQVTDIADAIIMTKLFGELWRQGTILIATSNRPPSDLYQGGLNREYFLPFIDELMSSCIVRHLKSPIDYRMISSTRLPNSNLIPVNDETNSRLYSMFLEDESARTGEKSTISIPVMMGREITVEARGRICYVTFEDMCNSYRGASDYSALARHMDVIYLQGVPILSVLKHDKARRFITLIDEIYDAGKRLTWTSDAPPQDLFKYLTPADMKDADFGTDHSWAHLDAVRGESGRQLGEGEPKLLFPKAVPKGVEQYEKDGGAVSMRFQEASNSTDVLFQDDMHKSSGEEKEIRLLEGELASIQELSFAFKRASSRLFELSSKEYVESSRVAAENTTKNDLSDK